MDEGTTDLFTLVLFIEVETPSLRCLFCDEWDHSSTRGVSKNAWEGTGGSSKSPYSHNQRSTKKKFPHMNMNALNKSL